MILFVFIIIAFFVVFMVGYETGKDFVFNKEFGFYIIDRRDPERPKTSVNTTKPIEELEKEKFIVLRVVEKPKI